MIYKQVLGRLMNVDVYVITCFVLMMPITWPRFSNKGKGKKVRQFGGTSLSSPVPCFCCVPPLPRGPAVGNMFKWRKE